MIQGRCHSLAARLNQIVCCIATDRIRIGGNRLRSKKIPNPIPVGNSNQLPELHAISIFYENDVLKKVTRRGAPYGTEVPSEAWQVLLMQ